MDWNAFWSAAWPVVKDIALGVLTLISSLYVVRTGYLKWIAGRRTEDLEQDRVDRNTTIRVLKQLLKEEREGRADDHDRCDKRISQLESDVSKFRTDVLEAVNVAERCSGMVEELTRHRNYYRERAQESSARNVRIHMELVSLRHRLGEPTTYTDLIIEPILDPPPLPNTEDQ